MKPDNDRRGRRQSQGLSLCQNTAQHRWPLLTASHSTHKEHSIQHRTGYCYSRSGYNMSIWTDCARMRLWLWCGDSIVKLKMCPICVI